MAKMLQRSIPRAERFLFHRSGSTLSQQIEENESVAPKMPPFDYTPPPYSGPSAEEILRKRREFLSPAVFHFFDKPLNLVDGKMQYLFDEKGKRYLDAFGGIATVCCGHCHPDVVDAIVGQTKRLQHSTILYLNAAIADFAEALAAKFPGDLKVVYFTNSGTEANELALLMARLYTGCHDVVSIRNGYHGNAAGTMGATAQGSYKFNVVQTGVHHALNPDQYRGTFGSDGPKYAKDVDDIIMYGTSGRVAAFIAEAIQGVGGIMELAPGYLPAVYNTIRKAGGLCIADEVQSGFARTGSHFWGFEAHGVVPDIVTMAKGIGNGVPLGAVVTTPEIAKVLAYRSYFNTFGGNPMCTAAGLAVLKVIEKENLQQNASTVGSYLKQRLDSLKNKYEIIGDVRGRGLMLGVELVTDRQLKTPAKVETVHILDQMKDMGVLVGKGGFYGNVFRITPPLCFTTEDADYLVDVMDYTLSKM
ncbi:alanine--glyoxylate aminotransferase 2 homolog 3, mitochondrial-like [Andrographis paniculata]|uniref:alanine--glyoxylate aminotransferase 2 homolog 3, mitochondrial-like n=1 Tax=Andrographis paniculata TaxID=175694 RepID=UPI0021E7139D|nr:alanine--glyoxylate aminotransferase 2 homolog 3, mitochondrial-like [Andrographis paniculata]XP_051142834.1 alanine--glyoxylate aminotransferase 2 homolog 3, mitochondrial-like [Andrographis paniculata]